MLNVIAWLVLGALVGWLGSLGAGPGPNWQLNIGLGVIGAVLGGLFFNRFAISAALGRDGVDINGLIVAFIGAISLLTIINVVRQGHGSPR